jgi:hypothetical protein
MDTAAPPSDSMGPMIPKRRIGLVKCAVKNSFLLKRQRLVDNQRSLKVLHHKDNRRKRKLT